MPNDAKPNHTPEELLTYWKGQKEYFLCAMLWDEEDLSDLDAIYRVYDEKQKVAERWTRDLMALDRMDDPGDIDYEVEMLIHEVLELSLQVDMKFGIYKLALEWKRMHPGEPEECFDFCFPEGIEKYKR